MNKIKVLFICIHNSFRSQIAEAILNFKYGHMFQAESAGINKKDINPLAIEAMKDYGLDISGNSIDSVFDFYKEGRIYQYVITVCSKEAEKQCPIFPGIQKRFNWNLEDPDTYAGTYQENYKRALILRDEIEKRIDDFVKSVTKDFNNN